MNIKIIPLAAAALIAGGSLALAQTSVGASGKSQTEINAKKGSTGLSGAASTNTKAGVTTGSGVNANVGVNSNDKLKAGPATGGVNSRTGVSGGANAK